jgi:hypothetical protein
MQRLLSTLLVLVIASAALQPLAFALTAMCCKTEAPPACHPQPQQAVVSDEHHGHHGHDAAAPAPTSTVDSRHNHATDCPMHCCLQGTSSGAVLIHASELAISIERAVAVHIADAQLKTYRFAQSHTQRGPPALLS